MPDVNETLKERGKSYGDYASGAELAMHYVTVLRTNTGYSLMSESSQFALTMILFKIARIVNGQQGGEDGIESWQNIAGYAELARKEAEKRNSASEVAEQNTQTTLPLFWRMT